MALKLQLIHPFHESIKFVAEIKHRVLIEKKSAKMSVTAVKIATKLLETIVLRSRVKIDEMNAGMMMDAMNDMTIAEKTAMKSAVRNVVRNAVRTAGRIAARTAVKTDAILPVKTTAKAVLAMTESMNVMKNAEQIALTSTVKSDETNAGKRDVTIEMIVVKSYKKLHPNRRFDSKRPQFLISTVTDLLRCITARRETFSPPYLTC
uniref:Uncharacterized protein n=1 Tax=Anopheles coluzzii TaxID=1518534 RepID=A0A8W7NZ05_ANOCL